MTTDKSAPAADNQCSSCGGFCNSGGCERENVAPAAEPDQQMVTCGCGDMYPIDSYGAGFIDAKGHCENCDAAEDSAKGAGDVVHDARLLPCPFCGRPAHMSCADETVNVRCDGWNPGECLGAGPNCYTEAEAIAGWNRRAVVLADRQQRGGDVGSQPSGNPGELDERSGFEAFAGGHGLNVRGNGDLYGSHVVAWAWKAWQARAALDTKKPAENIREGYPYDDPAFEDLCREYGIWGTAESALCAVFWRAANKADDARDAERYRWLKECNGGSIGIVQWHRDEDKEMVLTETMADDLIDTAIAQQRQGEGAA